MRKLDFYTSQFILLFLFVISFLNLSLLSKKSNISNAASFYYPKNDTLNHEATMLQKYLARYNEIAKMGSFQKIKNIHLKIALGDTSSAVRIIKNNLFLLGDMKLNNNSNKFDSSLYEAIISFQERHGMKLTGKISSNFIVELNRPIQSIIDQIKINIDRINKINTQQYENIFIVNIPEFILHVYENGQIKFNIKVIVGKSITPTVSFNDDVEYIVFSPYWNIPNSILTKEIIPMIKKNANYLKSHNMEWVGDKLRQRPGPDNPLGLIKFLFPNQYNIYLHDTPIKSLFNQEIRTFSHGCIRIEEAKKLALYILRNDSNFNEDKINEMMTKKVEKFIPLKNPIPIKITYYTAWVNYKGQLELRKDIYHKDF